MADDRHFVKSQDRCDVDDCLVWYASSKSDSLEKDNWHTGIWWKNGLGKTARNCAGLTGFDIRSYSTIDRRDPSGYLVRNRLTIFWCFLSSNVQYQIALMIRDSTHFRCCCFRCILCITTAFMTVSALPLMKLKVSQFLACSSRFVAVILPGLWPSSRLATTDMGRK